MHECLLQGFSVWTSIISKNFRFSIDVPEKTVIYICVPLQSIKVLVTGRDIDHRNQEFLGEAVIRPSPSGQPISQHSINFTQLLAGMLL